MPGLGQQVDTGAGRVRSGRERLAVGKQPARFAVRARCAAGEFQINRCRELERETVVGELVHPDAGRDRERPRGPGALAVDLCGGGGLGPQLPTGVDEAIQRFGFSATPGESLRTYFSSQAAALKGSQNLAGISDPAVDAMIDRVIAADSRGELTTACRALDRLLRAGRTWIPHWYKASHWVAYWDTFGRPPTKPRYARGVLETWWHDPRKASKIEAPG